MKVNRRDCTGLEYPPESIRHYLTIELIKVWNDNELNVGAEFFTNDFFNLKKLCSRLSSKRRYGSMSSLPSSSVSSRPAREKRRSSNDHRKKSDLKVMTKYVFCRSWFTRSWRAKGQCTYCKAYFLCFKALVAIACSVVVNR